MKKYHLDVFRILTITIKKTEHLETHFRIETRM